MATKLMYMPVLRSRQQENIVLKSFNFHQSMYPLIEIVKEHDRKRTGEKQETFESIYVSLIESISAEKVFVDMPVYLNERASTKREVLEFTRSVIANMHTRVDYMLSLSALTEKIVPVISSYFSKNGSQNTIQIQTKRLRGTYKAICFRILYSHFENDWNEVIEVATDNDFIILDLDTIAPYPSPAIRQIINTWKNFKTCPKIVIRSAINSDVQNIKLSHNDIIYEADNGLLEQFSSTFKANAFGDYAGVKKDDLTSGGTISPGFIFYDAIDNQYIGFKGNIKNLSEFEETIVPAVLNSEAVSKMKNSNYNYLDHGNTGWTILNRINANEESGKSQAKFKRIAIEHYLYCMKINIENGLISID